MTSPQHEERTEEAGNEPVREPTSEPIHELERPLMVGAVALITLIAFETLAVATAMPSIALQLDGLPLYALAAGAPMAAQIFTTPLAGHLSDTRGTRPCLIAGLTLFLLGVTVAGLAQTMWMLVLGRFVQGLGGGFLVVPLYVLVGSVVRPSRRGAFFAAFAAAWVLPSMVGPVLAGAVVEHLHWRWIFLGCVPVTIAIVLVLTPVLRRVPGPAGTPAEAVDPSGVGATSSARTLLLAAAAAGIAAALLQSVTSANTTSGHGVSPVMLAVGAIGIALLAWGLPHLVPAGTMSLRPGLPAIVGGRAMLNGAFVSAEVFLPLMLQVVHGWTPTMAGSVLTVGSVTWAIGSAIQARVQDDERRRALVFWGPIGLLVGIVAAGIAAETTPWLVLVGWTVAGLGIGISFPTLSVIALATNPASRHGAISSSLQLADTLGGALAIALTGAVFGALSGLGGWAYAAGLLGSGACAIGAAVAGRRSLPRA